jgi:hypothetical protein
MNALESWRAFALEIKWKRADHNNPFLTRINEACDEIEKFFNPKDFDPEVNVDSDNWMLHLLVNKQLGPISFISEIAELLRHLREIDAYEIYNLIDENGNVNHRGLRDRLLELYMHYVLQRRGLKPLIGQSYNNKKGNSKEIDLLLNCNNEIYNIECTKVYDSVHDEFHGLCVFLKRKTHEKIQTRKITSDEIFSGYIAFKELNLKVLKKQKELFEKNIKEHLHAYRLTPESTIQLNKKLDEKDFEFLMESAFLGNYEKQYEDYLKQFPAAIWFTLLKDFNKGVITAQFESRITHSMAVRNELLREKIKGKLKQHRDYEGPILIVVEISNVFGSHQKESSMLLGKRNIDQSAIKKLLPDHAMLMIIFKEIKAEQLHYDQELIYTNSRHDELANFLRNITPYLAYLEK